MKLTNHHKILLYILDCNSFITIPTIINACPVPCCGGPVVTSSSSSSSSSKVVTSSSTTSSSSTSSSSTTQSSSSLTASCLIEPCISGDGCYPQGACTGQIKPGEQYFWCGPFAVPGWVVKDKNPVPGDFACSYNTYNQEFAPIDGENTIDGPSDDNAAMLWTFSTDCINQVTDENPQINGADGCIGCTPRPPGSSSSTGNNQDRPCPEGYTKKTRTVSPLWFSGSDIRVPYGSFEHSICCQNPKFQASNSFVSSLDSSYLKMPNYYAVLTTLRVAGDFKPNKKPISERIINTTSSTSTTASYDCYTTDFKSNTGNDINVVTVQAIFNWKILWDTIPGCLLHAGWEEKSESLMIRRNDNNDYENEIGMSGGSLNNQFWGKGTRFKTTTKSGLDIDKFYNNAFGSAYVYPVALYAKKFFGNKKTLEDWFTLYNKWQSSLTDKCHLATKNVYNMSLNAGGGVAIHRFLGPNTVTPTVNFTESLTETPFVERSNEVVRAVDVMSKLQSSLNDPSSPQTIINSVNARETQSPHLANPQQRSPEAITTAIFNNSNLTKDKLADDTNLRSPQGPYTNPQHLLLDVTTRANTPIDKVVTNEGIIKHSLGNQGSYLFIRNDGNVVGLQYEGNTSTPNFNIADDYVYGAAISPCRPIHFQGNSRAVYATGSASAGPIVFKDSLINNSIIHSPNTLNIQPHSPTNALNRQTTQTAFGFIAPTDGSGYAAFINSDLMSVDGSNMLRYVVDVSIVPAGNEGSLGSHIFAQNNVIQDASYTFLKERSDSSNYLSVGPKITQLVSGEYHTVALLHDGKIKQNSSGPGASVDYNTPTNDSKNYKWGVSETPVIKEFSDDGKYTNISAGSNHTCGTTLDGGVKCWGRNNEGQSNPPEPPSGTKYSNVKTFCNCTAAIIDFVNGPPGGGIVTTWGDCPQNIPCITKHENCSTGMNNMSNCITSFGGKSSNNYSTENPPNENSIGWYNPQNPIDAKGDEVVIDETYDKWIDPPIAFRSVKNEFAPLKIHLSNVFLESPKFLYNYNLQCDTVSAYTDIRYGQYNSTLPDPTRANQAYDKPNCCNNTNISNTSCCTAGRVAHPRIWITSTIAIDPRRLQDNRTIRSVIEPTLSRLYQSGIGTPTYYNVTAPEHVDDEYKYPQFVWPIQHHCCWNLLMGEQYHMLGSHSSYYLNTVMQDGCILGGIQNSGRSGTSYYPPETRHILPLMTYSGYFPHAVDSRWYWGGGWMHRWESVITDSGPDCDIGPGLRMNLGNSRHICSPLIQKQICKETSESSSSVNRQVLDLWYDSWDMETCWEYGHQFYGSEWEYLYPKDVQEFTIRSSDMKNNNNNTTYNYSSKASQNPVLFGDQFNLDWSARNGLDYEELFNYDMRNIGGVVNNDFVNYNTNYTSTYQCRNCPSVQINPFLSITRKAENMCCVEEEIAYCNNPNSDSNESPTICNGYRWGTENISGCDCSSTSGISCGSCEFVAENYVMIDGIQVTAYGCMEACRCGDTVGSSSSGEDSSSSSSSSTFSSEPCERDRDSNDQGDPPIDGHTGIDGGCCSGMWYENWPNNITSSIFKKINQEDFLFDVNASEITLNGFVNTESDISLPILPLKSNSSVYLNDITNALNECNSNNQPCWCNNTCSITTEEQKYLYLNILIEKENIANSILNSNTRYINSRRQSKYEI